VDMKSFYSVPDCLLYVSTFSFYSATGYESLCLVTFYSDLRVDRFGLFYLIFVCDFVGFIRSFLTSSVDIALFM